MNLDHDQLQNTLREVALPAMAGAAGTGALGAYMSSRGEVPGESPAQRRHRILRNSLVSAGLGGMAGAALPTGLRMLSEPYFGSGSKGPAPFDRASDAVFHNVGPLAAGGGIGYWLHNRANKWRDEAQQHVLEQMRDPNMKLDPAAAHASNLSEVRTPQNLRQVMSSGDAGTKALLQALAGHGEGEPLPNLFRAAEMLHQAGHDPIYASDLKRMFTQVEQPSMFQDKPGKLPFGNIPEDLSGEYAKYLSSEGSLRRPFTKLVGMATERASQIPHLAQGAGRAAELYSQFARPGASRVLGRMLGPLGGLGLLGGGMWLGNRLQNKLTGD